jgi:hypothetical protein
MDDRRGETGLPALVPEHRIQHLARSGIQAERDFGQAQCGLHVGVLLLSNRMASMVSMPSLRDAC